MNKRILYIAIGITLMVISIVVFYGNTPTPPVITDGIHDFLKGFHDGLSEY